MSASATFARRGRRGLAAAGLVVGCSGLLRAADPVAPPSLDEVKVDLKSIKPGDRTELNDLGASARAALPRFAPAPDSPSAAPPRPPAAREEMRKKPASANWLLDAMAASSTAKPETGARDGPARDEPARGGERPLLDVSDPTFLLKLYLAQEPERSRPDDRRRPGAADRDDAKDVGPFDRFLSRWMSPREAKLLGFGEAASPAADGALAPALLVPFAPPAPTPAERPPNPYLEAVKGDLAPPAPIRIDLAPPTPSSLPPALAPPAPAAPAQAPPVVAPSSRADDEKYFPQLKRF